METLNGPLNRKLRMGLVDGRAEVVAGALSSDPERAKASAPGYGIAPDRAYTSYQEMIEKELQRPEDERIDFISITTPNHVHFPVAKAALEAGFNVICDKPMTFDFDQAQQLVELVEKSGAVFALTHNYTGYPLIRHARQMILNGELGEIQAIRSSYIQGWLRRRLEQENQKQAAWRTDPSKSGAAGAFGDIGTHAFNLGRYMTGILPESVSCNLRIFAPGRQLDDYGVAVIRYEKNALGTVTASQISHGRENDLFIEIDGTEGSLQWRQEDPNVMILRRNGQPHQMITRDPNAPFINEAGKAACRLPSGHPEGFFEAFANVYRAAFDAIVKRITGEPFETRDTIYPNVYDGAEGMYFIQQCVESSRQDGAWLPLRYEKARR